MSARPLILCICTYNQTRSVLMAALLRDHLAVLGVDADVASAGIHANGGRPLPTTVKLLADRGIDVADHRGAPLREGDTESADLIITAEQGHVIDIAARWPQHFERTFTLPELLDRIVTNGARRGEPIHEWRRRLNADRPTGLDYFDDTTVGEVGDPTGRDRSTWSTTFDQIDALTRRLTLALAQ